jgi:hypothetical protein
MTRASLECRPIFQEEVEISVPHPCRRVRTGTGKADCDILVLLALANNNLLAQRPDFVATF